MWCEKCKCASLNNSRKRASRRCGGSLFSQVRRTHPLICLFSLAPPSSLCNNPPPPPPPPPPNGMERLPRRHCAVAVRLLRTGSGARNAVRPGRRLNGPIRQQEAEKDAEPRGHKICLLLAWEGRSVCAGDVFRKDKRRKLRVCEED